MVKKNIFFVLALVLPMALFSQYTRTSGFLRFPKNANAFSFDRPQEAGSGKTFAPAPAGARDHFLIVYEGTALRT
ncbi:MAG: hypothetical protein LBO03_05690, partial [Acidaminococcales bacterium]|nr:hypothetical protein [Acidaminococcales bacterium]